MRAKKHDWLQNSWFSASAPSCSLRQWYLFAIIITLPIIVPIIHDGDDDDIPGRDLDLAPGGQGILSRIKSLNPTVPCQAYTAVVSPRFVFVFVLGYAFLLVDMYLYLH